MVNVGLRRPIFSCGFSLHRVLSRYGRDKPDLRLSLSLCLQEGVYFGDGDLVIARDISKAWLR